MEHIKKHVVPLIVMFGTAGMGLYGLHQGIPHSGWLLAIGVLTGIWHDWT